MEIGSEVKLTVVEPAKERVQKIHALPGVPMSPAAIFGRAMEWVDDIETVVLVIRTKGENWVVNWSEIDSRTFSMATAVLQQMLMKHLDANTDDGCLVDNPPGPEAA